MLKNIALLAVSVVFTLVVSEVLLRQFYERPELAMDNFKATMPPTYHTDAELGWLPDKNVQASHNRPGSFESQYSTNSLGLRDREHSFDRVPGKKRIVVVGDSFAWGYGVNDGEIFTDTIEQLAPEFEVINLGVTAYGLRQEIAYFKRFGMKFTPDILMVAFVQNDIYDIPKQQPESATKATQPNDNESIIKDSDAGSTLHRFKKKLSNEVVMYGLLVDALNSSPVMVDLLVKMGLKESLGGFEVLDPSVGPALKTYPSAIEMGWESIFEQLRGLKTYTDDNDIRLILALVPALQSVDPQALSRSLTYSTYRPTDFDIAKPYARIESFCLETGIEVINPLPAFVQMHDSGESLYLYGDMHFNTTGHQLFAEEISRYLVQ